MSTKNEAVDGVWPAGSCPPPAPGQVRHFAVVERDRPTRFTITGIDAFHIDKEIIAHHGSGDPWLFSWSQAEAAPLLAPWTDPAATPDPRIAELEADVERINLSLTLAGRNADRYLKQRRETEATADALEAERDALREDVARLTAERDAAGAKERADVVAWLRSDDKWFNQGTTRFDYAEHIENRAHVGASEK